MFLRDDWVCEPFDGPDTVRVEMKIGNGKWISAYRDIGEGGGRLVQIRRGEARAGEYVRMRVNDGPGGVIGRI